MISVKDSLMSITPMFWRMRPVHSMPTRAGKVVRLTSQPPKWAQMLRNISWYSLPLGGAAVSPTMVYRVHQAKPPINASTTILEHWR